MPLFHITLSDETVDMIKICDGKNMTEKLRNFIESPSLIKEKLLLMREEHERKIREINQILNNNVFMNLNVLTQEERDFFEDTIPLLVKKPHIMIGRKDAYNNKFGKHLTLTDFKLLIEEYRNKMYKDGSQ